MVFLEVWKATPPDDYVLYFGLFFSSIFPASPLPPHYQHHRLKFSIGLRQRHHLRRPATETRANIEIICCWAAAQLQTISVLFPFAAGETLPTLLRQGFLFFQSAGRPVFKCQRQSWKSKRGRRYFLPPGLRLSQCATCRWPELNASAPKYTFLCWLVVAEEGGTSCLVSFGDANEAKRVSQVFPEPLLKSQIQHRASGLSRSCGIYNSYIRAFLFFYLFFFIS